MGLDSTSQATKHLACLSGGTALSLAAFVGDEDGLSVEGCACINPERG